MSYGEVKEYEEKISDERFGSTSEQTSSRLPQAIFFPYMGPVGSGPGLLGTRPGSSGTEFLNALERHASSLKSALRIVHALRNKNEDSSSGESESPSNVKNENKKSRLRPNASLKVELPCVFNKELKSSSVAIKESNNLLFNIPHSPSKLSSSKDSNCDLNVSDSTDNEVYLSPQNGQILDSNGYGAVESNVICSRCCKRSSDLKVQNSVCVDEHNCDNDSIVKLQRQRLIFCSRNGSDNCPSEKICENGTQRDIEEPHALLKKRALRATCKRLQQFRSFMIDESEMSPQCKAVDGILFCLTSLCKEEDLWNLEKDYVVSLDIPL